jgi:hypothetical protein
MPNLEMTRSMFNIEEKIIPFHTRVGIGQVAGPGLFYLGVLMRRGSGRRHQEIWFYVARFCSQSCCWWCDGKRGLRGQR